MTPATPSLETLATINADGSRRFVHAATARGRFNTWRTLVELALMAIYVGLPWIPINGNPAVFFDFENRKCHLFGLTFAPQDFWLAFFLITGVAYSLYYVSALFGRVWCGWGCPQTVFLDVARRIERFFEGDAPQRRRLDGAPWTVEKLLRRGGKNLGYFVFTLLLAHVFMSYFVSLPRLWRMMTESPLENWSVFLFVFAMAAGLWFDLTWFREEFCIILCPYGRLQSALIDNDSVVIGYDAKRGEPRGKKDTPGAGACVDCTRCVQVCPTGIDIRQGLQMECIGCSACIDACDAIMDKLGRARGLIRYASMNALAGKPTHFIRPRIILYTALLLIGAAAMSFSLSTFKQATVVFLRMTGAPYYLTEGDVRNQYLLRVINKQNKPVKFNLSLLNQQPGLRWSGGEGTISVASDSEQLRPIVVTIPRKNFAGPFPVTVRVTSEDGRFQDDETATFIGPSISGGPL